VLVGGTACSRVYFGVHFPHDVLAGMVLGVLVTWGSQWLAVEAAGYPTRLLQGTLWLLGGVCTLTLTPVDRQHQLGLFLALGSLLASMLLRPWIYPNPNPFAHSDSNPNPNPNPKPKKVRTWRRLVLGLVPVGLAVGVLGVAATLGLNLPLGVFVLGIFNAFWILFGAPSSFVLLHI
jgi:hypothetical protein